MKRRKKNIVICVIVSSLLIGCLGNRMTDAGKIATRKIGDAVNHFFSELTRQTIWEQYSYLSYHLDEGGKIQNRIAGKISQVVPLEPYIEEKIDQKEEQRFISEESYPMMSPGELETEDDAKKEPESVEQTIEGKQEDKMMESESYESINDDSGNVDEEGVQDLEAASVLIDSQSDILPQIQMLPSFGGFTLEQMLDFQYLIEHLYVIDPSTSITENELNPKILLSKDLSISETDSGPQILIYHTHSQEAFSNSNPGEEKDTIVGVGNYLTDILSNTYGYHVIHHKGVYDLTDGVLDRDPAYDKALPDLEQILSDNPSIEVVIDLHRDGVDEDVHLVTEIDGNPTAKLMFFNGTCRDTGGERTDITNPFREDNLAFSLQMALAANANYPDLTRVIYLKTNRYNQHLRSRSALVEVGAQTNTVEEAYNAMPILADLIHQVIHRK